MIRWLLLATMARAETTISVDDLSVDGFEVRALRCTLDRGGLLASAMVVGALAAEKEAIYACGAPGQELALRWTWAGDTTVTHTGEQEVTPEHCLYKALRPIKPPSQGSCTATVVVPSPAP